MKSQYRHSAGKTAKGTAGGEERNPFSRVKERRRTGSLCILVEQVGLVCELAVDSLDLSADGGKDVGCGLDRLDGAHLL
jgi:hypothetical protein